MTDEAKLACCVHALAKIADPIGYLRREAEFECGRLNGKMAIAISEDHNTAKNWAREALIAIGHIKPKGT